MIKNEYKTNSINMHNNNSNGAIVSACAYTIMDRQIKLQEKQLNQTNNTKVINNTTVEVVEKENQNSKALGYKSDGSPMYSYAEIDNYVQSKYGQGSGWHLQDNGYVDLDKAGYTNDGRNYKKSIHTLNTIHKLNYN